MELREKVLTRNYLLLLVIALVGLFLRVYHLEAASLWADEAIAVHIAKLSLVQFAQAQPALELNPPLYFLILHYWIILFGESEFALRFLAVIFGVLAIPVMYLLGRLLFDEEAGLAGALILALSSVNVHYSQEARMYSLIVLLALLSMFFFVKLVRKNNLVISAAYVLVTTLMLYTHIFGLFVLVTQNICVLILLFLRRENQFLLGRWIAFQAIIFALFAQWIRVLVNHIAIVQRAFFVEPPTLSTFLHTFVWYSGNRVLLIIFVALSVCSLFTYTKVRGSMNRKPSLKVLHDFFRNVHVTNAESVMFLVVLLLTVNVMPVVISLFSRLIYSEKYAIAASVALYLLAAGGLRNINWRYVKLAVVVVIVILSAVNIRAYYSAVDPSWPVAEASNIVNENARSGDVVIIFPGYNKFIFDYYKLGTNADVIAFPAADYYSMSWGIPNTTERMRELKADINGHDRVWLVSEPEALRGSVEQLLVPTLEPLNESYQTTYFKNITVYDVRLFEMRS